VKEREVRTTRKETKTTRQNAESAKNTKEREAEDGYTRREGGIKFK
jgi:hypothetical protein